MSFNGWDGEQNGVISQGLDPRRGITRPVTLVEALPYSPQTSTVPFLPDVVPYPSFGSGSSALPLTDVFPQTEFEGLNHEIVTEPEVSKGAKQAVAMAVQNASSSKRTSYRFHAVQGNQSNTNSGRSLIQDLSPVTRAVYDRVGKYFKTTKPTATANGHTKNKHTKTEPSEKQASEITVKQALPDRENGAKRSNSQVIEVALPQRTFDDSAYIESRASEASDASASAQLQEEQAQNATRVEQPKISKVPLPPRPGETSTESASRMEIEFSSKEIDRDEYLEVAYVPDAPDAPQDLSTRRERPLAGGQGLGGASLGQRERGEHALDTLERLMRSIFSVAGNALGLQSVPENVVTVNDQEVTMTSVSQQKMQSALQKVIDLHCYDRVAVENLLRVVKLSEGSFKQLEDLDLRFDENWDEPAFDAWLGRLSDLDTALKAARTCLRIMSGGREEKQLYSEAIIQACVDLFKAVAEDIVTPIVELRSSGTSASLFKMIGKNKKAIGAIVSSFQKLFSLLASLVTKIHLSETIINALEYTSSKLIFVENAYYEKESAIGVSKFDGVRSVAMDMLCQIFIIKPEQRQGIVDDILTSLEKLPVGKQSSRQFKLSDGGSIQPVSALIMRLVQASSGRDDKSKDRGQLPLPRDDGEDEPQDDEPSKRHATSSIKTEEQGAQQHPVAIQDLEASALPLSETATRNANYVINFIVTRAISSSKSGDTPYRNLLDLFVDDFMTCLDSPEWPAAELLLRLLMVLMVSLFEAQKTAAPAKNMALEILGSLSATISRLRSQVQKSAAALEGNGLDELSRYLSDMAAHILEHRSQIEHVVAWTGPFRVSLEYLQTRSAEDPHLSSAISFLITDWATRTHSGYDLFQDNEQERDEELGRLAYRLRMMIEDRQWLVNEYSFKSVGQSQAKLSYSLLLLQSPLCESFNRILNILLGSMASDQATVRSKSLKSINQVLETDPSILDGDSQVIQLILECSGDSSTQVRDSALGLLGNCISMRPVLEPALIPRIIDRFQDAGVGVRKRAMKLARDVYLRNGNKSLRSAIANGLLRRVQDPDEGVRDLARQMMEEIWFAPFYQEDGTVAYQTSLNDHVGLIIQTVKTGTVIEILDKVFQAILKPQNREKALEGPFSVCSRVVSVMFGMINNSDSDSEDQGPSGQDALQVLTIFAKAEPKLFSLEQVRLLKPQLASFSGTDELAAFRAVTVIYKRVLPEQSTVSAEFLQEVRGQLQKAIGKVTSRGAFDDLIACFKVCCELLKDFGPLANLVASGLTGIQKLPQSNVSGKALSLLSAYAHIVGCVAKHCDLDQQMNVFRARIPNWQGDSVPRLIVDTLAPYSTPAQSMDARKAALEAIGLVCQAWPRNYVIAKVYTAFQQVFQEQVVVLEGMILKSFKEFLMTEEKRSEQAADGSGTKKKKELTVMGGTTFDDVASATTQRFLKDISRIATSTQDEHAFLAMEVLGSINRQGLTHPKETGVTLMTLETSANRKISELAFVEHRSLHEKHETVLEREYVKAVQSAFNYQRDIVHDAHGATTEPFQSKLHLLMEVMKISKMKNRQRFLEKLVGQVEFDLDKLEDSVDGLPPHLDFSRFIIENLAYLDYQTIGEVQTTVNTIEKMVTSIGARVAQAIESELFNVRMDLDPPPEAPAGDTIIFSATEPTPQLVEEQPTTAPSLPDVDPGRFRQLSTGSIVLLCLWDVRTHLRKLYGMGTSRHDPKAKTLAKDLNKTPTKVQGVHGDKIWDELQAHMSGLKSPESMLSKCKALVELMSVDKEFKVVDDDDEMGGDGPATPSEVDDDEDGETRGRKRKAGGNTPGGRKKRPRSNSQPRKRGRPRKNPLPVTPDEDAEGELDGDWI